MFTRDMFEKDTTTVQAVYENYQKLIKKKLSELYSQEEKFDRKRIRVIVPLLEYINSEINYSAISSIFNDFNWIGCIIFKKDSISRNIDISIIEKNDWSENTFRELVSFGVDLWLKKPDQNIQDLLNE